MYIEEVPERVRVPRTVCASSLLVITLGAPSVIASAPAHEMRQLDMKTLLARFELLDERLADATAIVRRELPRDFLMTVKSLDRAAARFDAALPNVDGSSVAAGTIVLRLRDAHTKLALAWKHTVMGDGGAPAALRAAASDFAVVAKAFSRDTRFAALTARFRNLRDQAQGSSAVTKPTVREIRTLLIAEEAELRALPRAGGVRLGTFYVETSRLRGRLGHAMRTTAHHERLAVLADLLAARETNRTLHMAFRNARG